MNASWKVVLAFIAVFVAGTIFGGGFALRISQKVAPRDQPRRLLAPPQQAGAPQPPLGTQLLRRFAENLDLSNEQRDKLKPLVLTGEAQIAQIRQASLEETEKILRKLQEDFRAELTPDQRRKLNRLQQRQQEAMRAEQMRRKQQAQQPFGPQNRPNQPFNPNQPRPNRPPGAQKAQPFGPPPPQFQPPQSQPGYAPAGPPPQGIPPPNLPPPGPQPEAPRE